MKLISTIKILSQEGSEGKIRRGYLNGSLILSELDNKNLKGILKEVTEGSIRWSLIV